MERMPVTRSLFGSPGKGADSCGPALKIQSDSRLVRHGFLLSEPLTKETQAQDSDTQQLERARFRGGGSQP
jgi:hypothetical protein